MTGDGCGGFIAMDKETTLRTEVLWARILIRLKGKERPSTVNILAGARSYELQIWWELTPCIARVYPSRGGPAFEKQGNGEEDECISCGVATKSSS